MRNPKRIKICLKYFSDFEVLSKFLNTKDRNIIDPIWKNWKKICDFWLENPDQRFGQLLCNQRLISSIDIEDKIWNIEENDWLIENDYCKFEDIKFWGVNYYKNGKKRKSTKYKLLKDLDLDHIKNIIKFFENYNAVGQLNIKYLEYFNKRIELDE